MDARKILNECEDLNSNKIEVIVELDDGTTTYKIKDKRLIGDKYGSTLMEIIVDDGMFLEGAEDKYHQKVWEFLKDIVDADNGWDDIE